MAAVLICAVCSKHFENLLFPPFSPKTNLGGWNIPSYISVKKNDSWNIIRL